MVQLSHPYMTTRTTIALTRWTFVGKIMSLLFNVLSRFVIAFLSRNKCLLISWLQSPFAVILEPKKIKSVTLSIVFPSICHEVMGLEINKFQWLNQNKYKFLISNTYNLFVLNIYIKQSIIAKWTVFILTTSDIRCVGFFLHQHQLGVQEFSSILTLPVRPTVKVLVPQGCPHFGC